MILCIMQLKNLKFDRILSSTCIVQSIISSNSKNASFFKSSAQKRSLNVTILQYVLVTKTIKKFRICAICSEKPFGKWDFHQQQHLDEATKYRLWGHTPLMMSSLLEDMFTFNFDTTVYVWRLKYLSNIIEVLLFPQKFVWSTWINFIAFCIAYVYIQWLLLLGVDHK